MMMPANTGMGRLGDQTLVDIITSAATAAGVPVSIALAQAQHESGMNPNATHQEVNGCVAYGLFQLEDCYFASQGDLTDPTTNATIAMGYLASLFNKYQNWADALDAYNEGPTAFDQGRRAGSGYATSIMAAAGVSSPSTTAQAGPPTSPATPTPPVAPTAPGPAPAPGGTVSGGDLAVLAVAAIVAIKLLT